MNDLVVILLILVVTIGFLLLIFAPPRREHVPSAPRTQAASAPPAQKRQVRRTNPLRVLGDFVVALFGGEEIVKTFEGEPIVHRTRRHWIVLLFRGFVPALITFLTFGLALFRWSGGTFIVSDIRPPGQFGLVEVVLIGLIVALLYLWQRSARSRARAKKKPALGLDVLPDLPYLLGVGLLGIMLYFRLQGGEIFYIDPFSPHQNDTLNQLLWLISFLSFIVLVYIMIDWSNDFLVLTPTRVIYEDTQLLVRQVQQEIVIENIQQVNVRADSYLAYLLGYVRRWIEAIQYWLGLRRKPAEPSSAVYARIIIGSFSPQTLNFDYAARPYDMQSKIQAAVGKLRRQEDVDTLRSLIEDQIYENKPSRRPPPQIEVSTKEATGLLGWFSYPNPEVRQEGEFEALTWRPVKLFLAQALARPYFTFLLPMLALWFFVRVGALPLDMALVIGLMLGLAMLAWGLWIREEHENDKFILNIREIVDVDKKPFGPESSRRAPLSSIQNIEFDVSFIESILGYGDVIISTAGGAGKFTFEHVPDARGVQATINNYLSYFKRRETERNLKGTLDVLQQYRKLQDEHKELFNDERIQAVVDGKVAEWLQREIPAQVEREVDAQVSQEFTRRVIAPLRRELGRSGLFRRRRIR